MQETDPMPWGKYKGTPIGEVPFDYLLKYYRKMWLSGDVLRYFENVLRLLETAEADYAALTGKKQRKYIIENYEPSYPYG